MADPSVPFRCGQTSSPLFSFIGTELFQVVDATIRFTARGEWHDINIFTAARRGEQTLHVICMQLNAVNVRTTNSVFCFYEADRRVQGNIAFGTAHGRCARERANSGSRVERGTHSALHSFRRIVNQLFIRWRKERPDREAWRSFNQIGWDEKRKRIRNEN